MPRINVQRVHRNPRFWTEAPITIERASESGAFVKGIWQPASVGFYSLQASVQPASANTIRSLPEGERVGEVLEVYADLPLFASDPQQSTQADYVRGYRGHDWKVVASEYWDEFGSHYSVITRLKKNRDAIPEGTVINELA